MTQQSAKWQCVGTPEPTELTDARLQLHWAAQLVMAAADAHIEHTADDSHTTMHWDEERRALVGNPLPSGDRVGVGLAEPRLLVIGHNTSELPLHAHTLTEARTWLIETLSGGEDEVALALRDYDMPEHAVSNTAMFDTSNAEAFGELARWFSNGFSVLRVFTDRDPRANSLVCWPHHFDIGATIKVDVDLSMERSRRIDIGMSPGDRYYNEPYFYVTPHPIRDDIELFDPGDGGHWHTDEFKAMVLPASRFAGGKNASVQHSRASSFMLGAIAVGHAVIPLTA